MNTEDQLCHLLLRWNNGERDVVSFLFTPTKAHPGQEHPCWYPGDPRPTAEGTAAALLSHTPSPSSPSRSRDATITARPPILGFLGWYPVWSPAPTLPHVQSPFRGSAFLPQEAIFRVKWLRCARFCCFLPPNCLLLQQATPSTPGLTEVGVIKVTARLPGSLSPGLLSWPSPMACR